MAEHISPDEIDRLASGGLSPADIQRVDEHMARCATCRDSLAQSLSTASGALTAVAYEGRRHLTFEELESCLGERGERALDALAASHLETCATCRSELADLRTFDALPARASGEIPGGARRAASSSGKAWWQSLPLAWAGALTAVLALVVIVPRLVQEGNAPGVPVQRLVVRLTPEGSARPSEPPRALRGGSPARLPDAVRLSIGRARVLANRTGQPQTIELQISPAEYDALLEELAAEGTIEQQPAALDVGADGADPISLSMTLVPAGRSGETIAPPGNAR